jgi:hypothetical protein
VVDNIGEGDRRDSLSNFALSRGGTGLTDAANIHASQGQGGNRAQEHGTNLVAPAQDQGRRTRDTGPGGLDINH